ncbi:MAG: class I SAM-dependent methyltransferase [Cyclobacteriaceae bacterium]|nr:class I SAM-dependent methyltransferase [Cyclobacteriaceae bacterium]
MNQEKHWNTIAPSYEAEIFDVFKSDRNRILPRYFKKHANKLHHAIDFGCGVGKAFPYLAPVFKGVLALDISEECLSTAMQRPYKNISFKHADLSSPRLKIAPADFAFCCNVIMLPEVDKNNLMFRNIQKSLKKGGNAVLVVPSLESVLYASWQLIRLYKKEGVSVKKIPATEFDYFKAGKRELVQGIIHINGVPTKHYLQTELEVLLKEAGLTITAIEKIEYDWNTEFDSSPRGMTAPYPWDWLVECRKK